MYIQKLKSQKTLNCMTLVVGVTMMTIGGAMLANQPLLCDTSDKGIGIF